MEQRERHDIDSRGVREARRQATVARAIAEHHHHPAKRGLQRLLELVAEYPGQAIGVAFAAGVVLAAALFRRD